MRRRALVKSLTVAAAIAAAGEAVVRSGLVSRIILAAPSDIVQAAASDGGVGFLISYHRTLFDTGHVYFGMLLALLLAVAVNIGLTRLDRRIGRWQRREQAQE